MLHLKKIFKWAKGGHMQIQCPRHGLVEPEGTVTIWYLKDISDNQVLPRYFLEFNCPKCEGIVRQEIVPKFAELLTAFRAVEIKYWADQNAPIVEENIADEVEEFFKKYNKGELGGNSENNTDEQ